MNILFLVLLAAAALLLQRRSASRGADGIDYSFHCDSSLVECDEEFHMISSLTNRRKVPVLFLHLSEVIPQEMTVSTDGTGVKLKSHQRVDGDSYLSAEQSLYLMPRQKATRTLAASVNQRGCYHFRSAALETGDILGLKEFRTTFERRSELVVYPHRAELPAFDSAFGSWYGEISVRRFILPDPILTIGFHDYTGREPMKDISWPQSLRNEKLMVKEYDYTSEPSATVLLNVSGADYETAEQAFRAMRTVCEKLEEKGIRYSVLSNASTPSGIGSMLALNDGCGHRHLTALLEGLGRASAKYRQSWQWLAESCRSKDNLNRGYILVSPALNEDDRAILRSLENRLGQQVLFVNVMGSDTT